MKILITVAGFFESIVCVCLTQHSIVFVVGNFNSKFSISENTYDDQTQTHFYWRGRGFSGGLNGDDDNRRRQRAQTGEVTVSLDDKRWRLTTGSWRGRTGEDFEIVVAVSAVNGMTAVCGVQTHNISDPRFRRVMPKVMRNRQLYINQKKIVQGFEHFTKVDWGVEMRRQPATCKVSNIPWSKEYGDPENWEIKTRGNGSYRL